MKNKNSKQLYKLVSLLLVIALLCQFPLNTIAIGDNETEITSVSETPVLEETVDNEVIPLVSAAEVPNFISQAQIEEHGHISRLSDEETLNTLVYLNRDGTKTKYIMDYPVKYVDENGNMKFVDLSMSEMATAFETAANDIVLSVSKDYTKGITLTYNDYAVSLVAMPGNKTIVSEGIGTAPIVTATKNNNAVTYNDVFGTDIDIRYLPLHNGVKEDIILQAYSGTNTFDFLLSTSGLGVYSEKDNYYLAEAANADMRMDLGKVIVYDANRKISEGSLTVTTLKENQLYQVTVSVDQAFLADPNTVYPVQIDPSITVSDTTHGANAVTDCPVYSGKPAVNMGTALYNPIGYLDSAYQIGRTAVKLVGLANDPVYQGLSAAQIQSAYFYIKDSSGTAAKSINLYALTSNSTWTESSLTWNTLGTVSPTLQASANVGGGAWSSFNITNLVKGWKSSSYNINCGFILQSSNESVAGNFFSSEAAESNWPYLVLNYTDIVSSITLSSTSVSIAEGGTKTLVATTNPIGQTVTWSTSNSAVATVSSSGVVTAKNAGTATITARIVDSSGTIKSAVCEVNVYIPSGVYRLKNVDNGMYLDVTGGGSTSGTEIQQWSRAQSDTNRNQLFKLVYLGTYGSANLNYYCIRSMTNSSMGVSSPYYTNGANVTLQSISTSDSWSAISYNACWAITRIGSTNVTIKNGPESALSYLTTPENSINGERVVTSSTVTSNSCWILEPYVDESLYGVQWWAFESNLAVGESFSFQACMYDEDIGVNGPIRYSVSDTDGSTTNKATINPTTGELIANRTGQIRVNITYDGSPYIWYRNVTINGYVSADLAALAFATEIYAASLYIRHEFSTEIYKVTENGETLYYYTEPAAGSPHSASGIDINRVPAHGTAVAYSHTHPNSNSFSEPDINFANYYYIDAYFNGPNVQVNKYDRSTNNHSIVVGTITPDPLTDAEKTALEIEFHDSWYGHIVDGQCTSNFNCGNMAWPTP